MTSSARLCPGNKNAVFKPLKSACKTQHNQAQDRENPSRNGLDMHICICHVHCSLYVHHQRAYTPPQATHAKWPQRHPKTGSFMTGSPSPPCAHKMNNSHKSRLSHALHTPSRRGKCIKKNPSPNNDHHNTPQSASAVENTPVLTGKKSSF